MEYSILANTLIFNSSFNRDIDENIVNIIKENNIHSIDFSNSLFSNFSLNLLPESVKNITLNKYFNDNYFIHFAGHTDYDKVKNIEQKSTFK